MLCAATGSRMMSATIAPHRIAGRTRLLLTRTLLSHLLLDDDQLRHLARGRVSAEQLRQIRDRLRHWIRNRWDLRSQVADAGSCTKRDRQQGGSRRSPWPHPPRRRESRVQVGRRPDGTVAPQRTLSVVIFHGPYADVSVCRSLAIA